MKSKKWVSRALKRVLVSYNGHTIYQVHIKDWNKVIQVKDFWIFEDYKTKALTKLLDYDENKLLFQGFSFKENDEEKEPKSLTSTCDKIQKVSNAKEK